MSVALEERKDPYDRVLFLTTLTLLLAGVAAVLDASYARDLVSRASGGDAFYSFKRQAVWAVVALGAMAVGIRYPFWRLRRFSVLGYVIAAALLVLVMVPGIGIEVNGSRRWLGIGVLRFQPSELAKIALVITLARYSEQCRGHIRDLWRGFVPAVLLLILVGGLIAHEDLGTSITVLGTGILMVLMMGARKRHVMALGGIALVGAVALVVIQPYRMERIYAWLDLLFRPLEYHPDRAYQPWQGLMALGSGGLTGRGIGQGTAKHLYLPAEHTDYIFATIGEEIGLIGCLILLFLFAVLMVRGLTVAHRCTDWFGSLLAAGLTCIVGIQAMLNLAVVSGLVPCTGVPLPFISYGGSSLVFTALAVGIILNVSRHPGRTGVVTNSRGEVADPGDGRRDRRSRLPGP